MWTTLGLIMRGSLCIIILCYTYFLSGVYAKQLLESNLVALIKFEMGENQTSIRLTWSNNLTAEVELKQEYNECIYRGTFIGEEGSSILVTGCDHRERNIQIQSLVYGDTLGTGSINGTITPVMGKLLVDDAVENHNFFIQFRKRTKRNKRESVDNPEFFRQYPAGDGSSMNIALPTSLILPLRIYLSPSWRNKFGGFISGKSIAKQVLSHVCNWFRHSSLDTKMYISYMDSDFFETEAELSPTKANLAQLGSFLASPPAEASAVVYLTGATSGDTIGIAYLLAICDQRKNRARSISTWDRSDSIIRTAQTVAHEIGHNLGYYHDFKVAKTGRSTTCGPGKWNTGPDNDLMNYGYQVQNKWSSCSNEDFDNYFSRVTSVSTFCLERGRCVRKINLKKLKSNLKTSFYLYQYSVVRFNAVVDTFDFNHGELYKIEINSLPEITVNSSIVHQNGICLYDIPTNILEVVKLLNNEKDRLVDSTNELLEMLGSQCRTKQGTLHSDLAEIKGFIVYLKDQFDVRTFAMEQFAMVEKIKKVMDKDSLDIIVLKQLNLLQELFPFIEIDELLILMTDVGFQFPNEKWTKWERPSIFQHNCSCEGDVSECITEETRTCLGNCLGPTSRSINICDPGVEERFHFFKRCNNKDASFRGSCVTDKRSKVGRFVSTGVSQAQCYDDCKALPGARGCEFIQQSCFLGVCVGPCFAFTEEVIKGDNLPDATCYKFNEVKGQSAPMLMRQVFDATQMAMTGVQKFNTTDFNSLTLAMLRIDTDLVQSLENGWNEVMKYQVQDQDHWGSNPSSYVEEIPKRLAISNSKSLLVLEPCNFASNWAYYQLMSSVASLNWMPKEVKKALGQSSAALALASSFFHGSNTKLGQYFDNLMRGINVCILHEAYMQAFGVLVETDSVLIRLTSTQNQMTGINMAQFITDLLLTEPSQNWFKQMKTIDVPNYEITYSALTLTILTNLGSGELQIDFFASQIMKKLQVSRLDEKLVIGEFLPKMRKFMHKKNIAMNARPDIYNLLLRSNLGVQLHPIMNVVDYLFNWTIDKINPFNLPFPLKVEDGTTSAIMEEFPGKSQCQKQQPHSIWHFQNAKALFDLFQIVDEIFSFQAQEILMMKNGL